MVITKRSVNIYLICFVCAAVILLIYIPSPPHNVKAPETEGKLFQVLRQNGKEMHALSPDEVYSNDYRPNQNDSDLLRFIRSNHLTPPSPKPYNLTQDVWDWKLGLISKEVEKLNMEINKFFGLDKYPSKRGFFIECGANNGEYLSNTIHLEVMHGWTGLLVEVDPVSLEELYQKNRKAWVADVCLATEPYPHKTTMMINPNGHAGTFIKDHRSFDTSKDHLHVPFAAKCLPLFSLLSALDVTTVDYFSLDVEGAELSILKTIPFDSLYIKVFSIEIHDHVFNAVDTFLASKGYTKNQHIKGHFINDYIYLHNTFVPNSDT